MVSTSNIALSLSLSLSLIIWFYSEFHWGERWLPPSLLEIRLVEQLLVFAVLEVDHLVVGVHVELVTELAGYEVLFGVGDGMG